MLFLKISSFIIESNTCNFLGFTELFFYFSGSSIYGSEGGNLTEDMPWDQMVDFYRLGHMMTVLLEYI